jgi:hypothetical protein
MEVAGSSETLATKPMLTQCHHPKIESTLPLDHCESLKSIFIILMLSAPSTSFRFSVCGIIIILFSRSTFFFT